MILRGLLERSLANNLRFKFDGDFDLERNLKSQIESVLKEQGYKLNLNSVVFECYKTT